MPSFSLLPSQPKFFELFEKSSAALYEIARALEDLMTHYEDVPAKCARITELEQQGDAIVHDVTDLAHSALIAPLDNEDSQRLIVALDDAIDAVEASAVRMSIFRIEQPTETARQLAGVISRGAQEVREAMPGLRDRRHLKKVKDHIVRINDLENAGDRLLRRGLEEIVEQRADLFNLIRWKEIYEYLEETTDRIEDIGDVLQRVLIKNA